MNILLGLQGKLALLQLILNCSYFTLDYKRELIEYKIS